MSDRCRDTGCGATRDGVIFEFFAVGNAVKVCAIDEHTGLEVTIVGPVSAGEEALRRKALAKLRYALGKKRPAPLDRRGFLA
jgi:hypothetical protein